MEQDEFSKTVIAIIFMIIMIAFVFSGLLILPEGRLYEATKVMLPVLPVIILIVATMLYVKATFNIVQETQLQRKSSFIEKMIKKILFPLLDRLNTEIGWFQRHLVFGIKKQKCDLSNHILINCMFTKTHQEVFFKIFTKHYPNLSTRIIIHDEEISKIDKICNDIIDKINTKKFRDKWKNKANYYMTKVSTDDLFPFSGEDLHSKIIDCILESIIYKKQSINMPKPFWNKYNQGILLEREKYEKDFDTLNERTKEILDYLEDFKNDVISTIDSEQEKYGILAWS